MKESLKVRFKKKIKFSNVMVCVVSVLLILFTLRVLNIVENGGYEPGTLIASVFAAGLGEFGILGWIRTTKSKTTDSNGNND